MTTYREQLQTQGDAPSLASAPQVASGLGGSLVRLAGSTMQAGVGMVSEGVRARQEKHAQQEATHAIKMGLEGESRWEDRAREIMRTAPEDGAGALDQFESEFDEYASKSLATFKTQAGRERAAMINTRMREALRQRLMEYQARALADTSAKQSGAALDAAEKLVRNNPGRYSDTVAQALTLVDELPGLNAQQRRALASEQLERLSAAAADALLASEPSRVAEQAANPTDGWAVNLSANALARAGEMAQKIVAQNQVSQLASGIMSAYERNQFDGTRALTQLNELGLSDEQRVAVQKEVRERLNLMHGERRQVFMQDIAQLNAEIAVGAVNDDSHVRALSLYAHGAISEESYSSMLSSIWRARMDGAQSQALTTAGLAAIRERVPLDPRESDDRKSIAAAFAHLATQVDPGSLEWQNIAVEIARDTNIAPASAISWARSIILGGRADDSVKAAGFLRKLEQANPRAFGYFEDDRLKTFVQLVTHAIDAGALEADAVAVARRNAYDMSDAERQYLRQQYAPTVGKKKGAAGATTANVSALQSRLNSDDRYDKSLFGMFGAPEAPVAMRAEYDAGVQRYYEFTGGDIEQARELAWRDVTRKWGFSTVNGNQELLPYAPEVMFPGLSPELIRNDLNAIAGEIGMDGASLRLIQSPETERTDGAEWFLGAVGEYGQVDLVLGKDARPQRYELPVRPASHAAAMERVKAEEMRKAREWVDKARQQVAYFEERLNQGDPNALQPLRAWEKVVARGAKGAAGQVDTREAR